MQCNERLYNYSGISKMHYYRRALPKSFGDFVLTQCVTYVRRANNITASTNLENYAKCHGGIQVKFSNDRQKVVRIAAERCPTSRLALDLLYAMDEEYIEDMSVCYVKGNLSYQICNLLFLFSMQFQMVSKSLIGINMTPSPLKCES